ncbi:MAG TPA: hypothetical protein PKG71_02745 [Candidatus Woesebacteria bacterium]|nr:hypothetical protein [Candidatus Woesebacteria bacterium]HNS94859.1 hypothetical protein [Candidatus Woesebacteria bacterium]
MAAKSKPTPSQKAMSEALQTVADEDVVTKAVSVETPLKNPKERIEVQPKKAVKARVRGARYQGALKTIKEKAQGSFSIRDAIQLLKDIPHAQFEETLELHVNMLEEVARGEVQLPYSTGKKIRVAVADDALIDVLEKGMVNFDVLVTTPAFMPKLTKFAKLLGPKGLMPNPKAGTIGPNTEDLVAKFSGNTVRYKTEPKNPVMHLVVGKMNMSVDELVTNVQTYIAALDVKNIQRAYLTSTMSPSVQVTLA